MLEKLFSPQLNNLSRGLQKASARQGLLTANLANVNVPGYKRKDLDFNIALESEMKTPSGAPKLPSDPKDQVTTDEGSIRRDGNSVDLEREVQSIAETELRYQTLTDLTANYFSGMKNVIREGK